MEVVLDESPEAQSRFQVALPDSQLSAPGTGPQWVLSGRMNERTNRWNTIMEKAYSCLNRLVPKHQTEKKKKACFVLKVFRRVTGILKLGESARETTVRTRTRVAPATNLSQLPGSRCQEDFREEAAFVQIRPRAEDPGGVPQTGHPVSCSETSLGPVWPPRQHPCPGLESQLCLCKVW